MSALDLVEDLLHLLLGHDHRETGMPSRSYRLDPVFYGLIQDVPVQEDNGIHGLPLGGCRYLAMGGQVTQKAVDLALAHVFRMGFAAVEFDESENPVAVGLLRTVGIVVISEDLADLVHQPQAWIRPEFFLAFHVSPAYPPNTETRGILFPCSIVCYHRTCTLYPHIGVISRKLFHLTRMLEIKYIKEGI